MREVSELPYAMLLVSYFESYFKGFCWNGTDRVIMEVMFENMLRVSTCALVMDLTRWSFKCLYESIGDDSVTNEQLYIVELQGLAFGYMIGKPLGTLVARKLPDILFNRDEFNSNYAIRQERAEFRKKFRNTSENFTVI